MHTKVGISIRTQIIQLVLGITLAALLLTALFLMLFTIRSFRETQKSEALSTAGFSAEYCTAPLLFDDEEAAITVLENFKYLNDFKAATLYTVEGDIFAQYAQQSSNLVFSTFDSEPPFAQYYQGDLYIYTPVKKGGTVLGTLALRIATTQLTTTISQYILFISFILIAIAIITYVVAKRMQMRITQPIYDLVEVSEQVALGNMQSRVTSSPNNELGFLGNKINDMLDQINLGEIKQQKAQILLHDIIDSMPSLLLLIDTDNAIMMINQQVVDYLGKPIETGTSLFQVFPTLFQCKDSIDQIHRGCKIISLRAIPVSMGDILYADITLFALADEDSPGIVLNIDNVTALIEKDSQLMQIQKMETMGTLAGGIAHDFNNIMSGIVGTLSLMEIAPSPISVEMASYINLMKQASSNATKLISRLLSLSHKNDIARTTFNLSESLESVATICKNSLDKSIELTVEIPQEEMTILGDASQIEQVLLNLCINGAHAMTIMRPEGAVLGGELKIQCASLTLPDEMILLNGMLAPGTYAHIRITDTGIGIPEQNIKRIFDPFFTTKDKSKGLGLGLSMVYNIIEKNDGFLNLTTKLGYGTTFELYFPLVKSTAFEEEPANVEKTVQEGKGRVLVIDDDAIIHIISKKMLESAGYTVTLATNGMEGLDYYSKHKDEVDIIILDMAMPGLSGKEVFIELLKIEPKVKVLLSSGFSQDDRVLEILELGVKGFLHKPFRLEEILSKVKEVLEA